MASHKHAELGDTFLSTLVSIESEGTGLVSGLDSMHGCRSVVSLRPTLSVTWYHCISTRIIMFAISDSKVGSNETDIIDDDYDRLKKEYPIEKYERRFFAVVKSPISAICKVSYRIVAEGFVL